MAASSIGIHIYSSPRTSSSGKCPKESSEGFHGFEVCDGAEPGRATPNKRIGHEWFTGWIGPARATPVEDKPRVVRWASGTRKGYTC